MAETYEIEHLILVSPQVSVNLWSKKYVENVMKNFGQKDEKQYVRFHSHDINFAKVGLKVSKITVLRGSLDPYIPRSFVEAIQTKLPFADYIELEGLKHMGVNDKVIEVPEIYKLI